MLHSFSVKLGKIEPYGTDFFSDARTLWSEPREANAFAQELQTHFPGWKARIRGEDKLSNKIYFYTQTGIVRLDHPGTNEFFFIACFDDSVNLSGRLSKEHIETLQQAFNSYGHGLEKSAWKEDLDLFPEKRHGNLALYEKLFTNDDVIVSCKSMYTKVFDDLILSAKGVPDISLTIPLEFENGTKKSRAEMLKNIKAEANALNEGGVTTYMTFMYGDYIDYDHKLMKDAIQRSAKLKDAVLRSFEPQQTADLRTDEKPNIKSNTHNM